MVNTMFSAGIHEAGLTTLRIHLSVMFFEIFTIFVPCFLVIRQKVQSRKAAATNAKWETSSDLTLTTSAPDWTMMSHLGKKHSLESMKEDSTGYLLTLAALNRVLDDDPGPLQEFSALRDFSGENISFLTRVACWKSSWAVNPTGEEIRDMFTWALGIYTDLISPHDAQFPINLLSNDLRQLEAIFEEPARVIYGERRVNTALPFEGLGATQPSNRTSGESAAASSISPIKYGDTADRIRYLGDIPNEFGPKVFDAAQKNVKYLVLTNTWPKFVNETIRRRSIESERFDLNNASQTTLVGRVAQAIKALL